MNNTMKSILPKSFTLDTMDKPMQAGEIYHLWEALSSGYQIISLMELYMMNTEDKKLHLLLNGMIRSANLLRITKIEDILKDAGFTVPPRPASKMMQGKPGVGVEVKLSDEEIIKVMFQMSGAIMELDGKGINAVSTNNKIRNVFVELLFDDLRAHAMMLELGMARNALIMPPMATAVKNSLTIGEVYWLWFELDYRQTSIIELESFLANTNDEELKKELNYGLSKVAIPQLVKIENTLKKEGFTVPSRPVNRTQQQPKGVVGKISMSDNEVINLTISATQIALSNHIRAYASAFREDIHNIFKNFIEAEIETVEKMMKLAISRNMLLPPPNVSAKRG